MARYLQLPIVTTATEGLHHDELQTLFDCLDGPTRTET